MGIKELIKKHCKTCGRAIPYAWNYCQRHGTFKPYQKQTPKMVVQDYKDVVKMFKIHPSLAKVNLVNREYLIIDENGFVVGYK